MPFLFYSMLSSKNIIPIDLLRIEDDGAHLVIKGRINGKLSRLLIDTGASRSVFDKERILHFTGERSFEEHDKYSTGLGTDSMPTSLTRLKTFRLGSLALKNFEVVLLDLSHVIKSYEKLGLTPIDGVIGNDILLNHKAVIDYRKMELKLK